MIRVQNNGWRVLDLDEIDPDGRLDGYDRDVLAYYSRRRTVRLNPVHPFCLPTEQPSKESTNVDQQRQ
jgi:hypothetical protein